MIFYKRIRVPICKTDIYRPFIQLQSGHNMVYIRFLNGGFEILWCHGIFMGINLSLRGVWGPPRKFRNMKCSRSDSLEAYLGLVSR